MKSLRTLSIKKQLLVILGFVVLGFAVFGACSFRTLGELRIGGPLYGKIVQGKDLVADILPPPNYIIESYLVALELSREGQPQERARLAKRLEVLRQDYETRHTFWQGQSLEPAMARAFLQDSHEPVPRFFELAQHQFIPALERGDRQAAETALGKMKQAYEAHRKGVDQVVGLANSSNQATEKVAAESLSSARIWLLAVFVISLGVGLLLFLAVTVPMAKAIRQLTEAMGRLAKGDLTAESRVDSADELGDMSRSLNRMAADLRRVVQGIRQGVEGAASGATQLSASAEQMAAASSGISRSAGNQNVSSDRMVAAVTELASSIDEVKRGAQASLGRLDDALEATRKGNQAGAATQEAMQGIAETAAQIARAVTVIQEIARQTNLLSLNAAIEAAKAGVHGKGFAVVAEAVRQLAERSSTSAKEIDQLIDEVNLAIGKGSSTVATAVELLGGIRVVLEEFAASSRQTALATEEQAHAGAEVAQQVEGNAAETSAIASAIAEMSATTTEVARTSSELHRLAEGLQLQVQAFAV